MARFAFCLNILGIFSFIQVAYSDDADGLILTPYIRNGSASLARTLSKVDPSNFLGFSSHSGFITVKDEYNSNIFFWFFPHEKAAEKPWIIWLQGGPGFSSLMGLFGLIGPVMIEDDQVKRREISWAEDYSLLFIDNPVGAGFSYTKDDRGYTSGEDEIGEQLLEFLVQFLQVFPEMKDAPLFLAGESYAGKYVPTLGVYIHEHNKKGGHINLKGIAMGNGLIDPRHQLGHSLFCSVFGILGPKELRHLQKIERDGITFIDEGRMVDAANKFNESIEYIKAKSGVSVYNIIGDPSSSSSAPEFENFVNRPEVRGWIHVGKATFTFNNQYVYKKMLPDIMNTTRPFVEQLLEHYGVLSYSGHLDIILPTVLSKKVYDHLEWSRRSEYENAPTRRMRSSANSSVIGYRKSGGNFVDVVVRKSGHMVPKDQPDVLRYIISTFIDEFS